MKGGRRQSFWVAYGTGYGWLVEEDTNRRKTDEKKKKNRDKEVRGGSRLEGGIQRGTKRENRGKEKVHPEVRLLNHILFAIDIFLDQI